MGKTRNEYKILVGNPEGKRPLGRPRYRWEDNDLQQVLMNSVMNLWVP
jgi:hypothetical protein